MRSYTMPAGDAAIHKMIHKQSHEQICVWPRCGNDVWGELRIAICAFHAAHVYLKMEEVRPKRDPQVETPAKDLINGTIYYAEAEDGSIKIGFTTDVRNRMSKLRTRLLAAHPGTRRDERAAHMQFGEYWTKGEYFRPGPRLMERIRELQRRVA